MEGLFALEGCVTVCRHCLIVMRDAVAWTGVKEKTTVPGNCTPAELLKAARELAPQAAAAAEQIERDRRLPESLVQAMADAGLFRMLVPVSLGGSETGLTTFARVIEEIAKADASTAWCLCQGAGTALIAVWMEREAAQTIFGSPRAIVARGPGTGTAVEVDGGYRLTGRWSFASGCHHATWLEGYATLIGRDGRPIPQDDGAPVGRTLLFPAPCAEIIDVWQVSGLRGTGSDSFAVTDLFVPEACAVSGRHRRGETGRLYAFPSTSVYSTGFASVAIGIARGALDAFVDLARKKTPSGLRHALRENGVVQSQVAHAEAGLRSARAFLQEAIGEAWNHAGPTGTIPLEDRVLIRLATTHAIHGAAQVVDTVYHAAGATAIFTSNPFERRFRDVHAVTQQIQGSQAHFETAGQFFLGLPPDMALL